MSGALLRYRVIAWVVGVFLLLLTFGVVVRYTDWLGLRTDLISRTVSPIHGFGYMLYLAAGVDLAFRVRWPVGRTLLVLLAGTVPFLSFVAERSVTREVSARIADDERLAAGDGRPPAAAGPRP
jgi:integral membrane protein